MTRTLGGRVQKLSIHAGFTCPNRDGTLGTGGCTFCSNPSFSPSYCQPERPVAEQIDEGIRFFARRYRRVKRFIAYFQAYSNTYAPLPRLQEVYQLALSHPRVVGIAIGTRPDCVDRQTLDYLAALSKNYHVSVEYGVEACRDEILRAVNRGHSFAQSVWAIEQTASRGLHVCGHFILGLPGHSAAQMLEDVRLINQLPLTSIKFHQLQVVRGTALAQQYLSDPQPFRLFSAAEYVELMASIVERLNPNVVVERIAGQASPGALIAPRWEGLRADGLLAQFERVLEERNTWQGRLYAP